jgi:aryl-alcohol dehydrogenase-like predicted oxidoreductase
MGVLTGKYSPGHPPAGFRSRRYSRALLARTQRLIDELKKIGSSHGGKNAAQVALNWVICKGAIPIPGAKTAQQAESNAGALGWRLNDAEIQRLDQLSDFVLKED